MSTLSLALIVFFGVSLFSASLLLAACVASSRSQRIVSRHKEKLAVNHKAEKSLSDMCKNRPIASSTMASVN
jgi:hypothetical protein